MFDGRPIRVLLLAGLVLLGLAGGVHTFEHWERVSGRDCVAHAGEDLPTGKTGATHDHGCTVQDHAPAIVSFVNFIPLVSGVREFVFVVQVVPVAPPLEIEHPPQITA